MQSSIFTKIPVYKSNRHYRLGDLIFKGGFRWKHDRDIILAGSEYDNTLLKDYLIAENKVGDIDTLAAVVQSRKNMIYTQDNQLYVNLRLGDLVNTFYGKQCDVLIHRQHVIKRLIENVTGNNTIDRVIIVTALHYGDNEIDQYWQYNDTSYQMNKKLFMRLEENVLNNLGIKYEIINQVTHMSQIDFDFITLCLNKHVIVDRSQFGKLITKVRDNIYS